MHSANILRRLESASENDLDNQTFNTDQAFSGQSPVDSASVNSIELETTDFPFTIRRSSKDDIAKSAPPVTDSLSPSLVLPQPQQPNPICLPSVVIYMRNVTKPGKPPLKNFRMTVEKGTIYGLVGPVGCGKSVVLSLIVGLKEVKGNTTGTLSILGSDPDSPQRNLNLRRGKLQRYIGFMPQEIALYEDLSITETFAFYGRLYGMSRTDINSRRKLLIKLFGLKLQAKSRCVVGKMSRAHKSLFGLAVTLLHYPEIIVLDEPFAFMDPDMKSKVFHSISKLTSAENATFVIATRSVEDVATSNKLGLMRQGRMLAELSPIELLSMSTSTLFTEAYLQVYRSAGDPKDDDSKKLSWRDQVSTFTCYCCDSFSCETCDVCCGNRIQSVVWINLVSLVRSWMLTIFLVVCPTLIISIPWTLFNDDIRSLGMGYVNLENVYGEPCFKPAQLNREDSCDFSRLSCLFLSRLSQSILHLTEYASVDLARDALHDGEIWGFIEFPQMYSDNFQMRYEGNLEVAGVLEGSTISVEMDMTSSPVASRIQSAIQNSYSNFTEGIYLACSQQVPVESGFPIKYTGADYGSRSYHTLEEFLIPGLLVLAMYFIPMCTFSLQQLRETQNGLYKKKRMAGVSYWEVLISAWVKEIVLTIFRLGLCLPIIFIGFRIEPTGSLALLICILFLMSLAGVTVGLAIALVCEDCEVYAMSFVFFAFMQNLLFAGILWPTELTSSAQYYMSSLLPCTLPAEALRSIISRGWGITYFAVWSGLAYPGLIILACCFIILYFERTSTK